MSDTEPVENNKSQENLILEEIPAETLPDFPLLMQTEYGV